MKYCILIMIVWGCFSCVREGDREYKCSGNVVFDMQDVAYVFLDDSVIGYRPYYEFTKQLDILAFRKGELERSVTFDYQFCRDNRLIPFVLPLDKYTFLLVANLYDPKAAEWHFQNGEFNVRLSILDHEEPPAYLASIKSTPRQLYTEVPVELKLLVSRLEIQLVNPQSWVTGVSVSVRDIAASITNDYVLDDTTSILKRIQIDNTGSGTYNLGVNTFPTYTGHAASLSVNLTGNSQIAQYVINDERLNLYPGIITRLQIGFDGIGGITVKIEIEGKWEIVDEGIIEI